ncbi:MAG: hypothetical protein WAW42_01555 [Candidatus Competibacteraceae bacterium]
MDPKQYFEEYTKAFVGSKTMSSQNFSFENLVLPENCYRNHYYPECYIETMNRAEMLEFIKSVYGDQSDKTLTVRKFSARIENIKNQLQKQTAETVQLVAQFSIHVDLNQSDIAIQRAIMEKLIEKLRENNRENMELSAKISALNTVIFELYGSTSWRITAPLRFLSRIMQKAK